MGMEQLSEGDFVTPQIEQEEVSAGERCVVEHIRTRVDTEDNVTRKYLCGSEDESGGFAITHNRLEEAVEDGDIQVTRSE